MKTPIPIDTVAEISSVAEIYRLAESDEEDEERTEGWKETERRSLIFVVAEILSVMYIQKSLPEIGKRTIGIFTKLVPENKADFHDSQTVTTRVVKFGIFKLPMQATQLTVACFDEQKLFR